MAKHLNSIHVEHRKHTAACPTEVMPVPKIVKISMSQHIGAPCQPLVKRGDEVKVGQKIAETEAFVSAPIHSSVSGKVKSIDTVRSVTGGSDQVVVIETDGEQEVFEEVKPPKIENFEEFVKAIKESGLVGLGGAAFPTHIKYNPKNIDEIHTLIINAAECEPYITSDHRLMVEDYEDIILGIETIMGFMNLSKAYIGIESNKPDAIAILSEAGRKSEKDISVVTLRSRYPQGAERVMVYEITGKTMNAGILPAQLGLMLSNVTTVAFVGQYMKTGMPLINKRITVDGDDINEPKNIIVSIGTLISDVAEFCGGYKQAPKKIIMGGPMMGRAVFSDQTPIIKNNNAILIFSGEEIDTANETQCIKCGKCNQACPFDLFPLYISDSYERKDVKKLRRLRVDQCMECGSCAYVCPARKPLGFTNKMSKLLLKEEVYKDGK